MKSKVLAATLFLVSTAPALAGQVVCDGGRSDSGDRYRATLEVQGSVRDADFRVLHVAEIYSHSAGHGIDHGSNLSRLYVGRPGETRHLRFVANGGASYSTNFWIRFDCLVRD